MKNKALFKESIKKQPKSDWIRGSYGEYSDSHHCKLGWVIWDALVPKFSDILYTRWLPGKGTIMNLFTGVEYLKSFFDLTEEQVEHIIQLNDTAENIGQAEQRIVNYVNHLRNT